ncbi:hypothetical protein ACNAW0_29545 [Micromonospora sp. SL1-18]
MANETTRRLELTKDGILHAILVVDHFHIVQLANRAVPRSADG